MKLPISGQGIILFKYKYPVPHLLQDESKIKIKTTKEEPECKLILYDITKKNQLFITITETSVKVIDNENEYKDPDNNSGLVPLDGAYYWLSIDSQNQQIYVGIGEPRLETVIYKYKWGHEKKKYLESHYKIKQIKDTKWFYQRNQYEFSFIKIIKDPITQTIPLKVKHTHDLTMTDIASQKYLPKANLSLVSQKLYDCISGINFILDDTEFPEFSKAIEYSIATPGLWCNKTLQDKSTEFDPKEPNIKETYLRITLGQNNGESPGIPYVMEIWPSGHYSPIHSHANASAVIRVLHGSINVKLYPFLCGQKDALEPFAITDFNTDDITWISPTLNQTHKLENIGEPTCITIQCYMYEDDNINHYDFFDYLDSDGKTQQYEPDSDMEFIEFKQLMKKEWSKRTSN
jgi:hypothetical protein